MKAFFRETRPWWKNKPMNFHLKSLRQSAQTAIFLPLIVALAYCKRPEQDLGLNLQPEGDLLNVLQTDTLTLQVFTEVEDSLRSDELSRSMLGNTIDPQTGMIRASFYTQLRLSAPDIDFGNNPVPDSIVLSLKYLGQFWGKHIPQSFEVLEVSETLEQTNDYFTSQDFEIIPGSLVHPSVGEIPINVTERLLVGEDSVNAQLRIPLSLDFANRLLTAGADVYDTNEDWLEYFKGILVRSISSDGAVLSFDLVDTESLMRLYYHNDTDTAFYDFNINALCARSNRFSHQFFGPLAGLNVSNTIDGSIAAYVQGGGRLKTRIEMPHLDDFNLIAGKTINKAELFLPVADAPQSRYPNIPLLFVLTETADGNAVGLPGQLSTTIDIGGAYETANNRYRFNVTRWFQDYLNGNQAVNFLHVVSSNGAITVGRTRLNGPGADPENPERNMRLVVTYTD
jgi:hypothetical protein